MRAKPEFYRTFNEQTEEWEWRWRVVAANGEVDDASHEGFATKWNAKRNYRKVRDA